MNVDTFLEAKDLYDKYSLCESVLEYLSDEDLPQGQKYLETLKMFVNVFPNDFMMFVHNKMLEIGAMFEELHCPEHSDSGLQPPILPPTEEKEPKFSIGSKVEIISGIGKGDVGVVKEYESIGDTYYVVSDSFSMWFTEPELKAYLEEKQEPENPEENGGTTETDKGE